MSIRLMIIVGCAAAFGALSVSGAHEASATPVRHEPSAVLHQETATAMLRGFGIRRVSSGGCAARWNPHCTSLEGVRQETIGGLLALKDASGCPLVVSGGTEVGHTPGPFSHDAGYKLDVLPNRCVNAFIRRNFEPVPTRGDGARQYRGPGLSTFAREPSHWDITFA
jgi:hypothetical protein